MEDDYPELKEPSMTFDQILALLNELSDDELEILDEGKFVEGHFKNRHKRHLQDPPAPLY